jgi:hypothetical protein
LHICKEADRLKNHCTCTGNGTKDVSDEALAITAGDTGIKMRRGKCCNCGKPGHQECKCRTSHWQGSTGSNDDNSSGSGTQATSTPTSSPSTQQLSDHVETRCVANTACVVNDRDILRAIKVLLSPFDVLLLLDGIPGLDIGSEAYLDPLEQAPVAVTLINNEAHTVGNSDVHWTTEEDFLPLNAHSLPGNLVGPATSSEGSQPPLEHVFIDSHPPTLDEAMPNASCCRPDPGARKERQPS